MAKLERMNLLGIRSFGPDDRDIQKITFVSPLTLIQGQNGCGKTTIIEAIKFAITGELPGGTARGQGFVYDPKLSKAFETVGKVKLRIAVGLGVKVTSLKIVRVTQRGPDKLEFKRLDSTITWRKPNEPPTHTSSRCSDVDQEMCIVLGVSKAIINQVLFCHQEDSNWPLEESKKLKERFDEIFDAAKYNRCTEHFDKKIKQKTEQSKLMKISVDVLHDKKMYVERKRSEMHEKMEKYNGFNESVTDIENQLQPINKRINELYVIEQNFSKVFTNIESKKKVLELLEQQQNDLLKNLKEFDGDDAELEQKMNQFERELKTIEGDIEVQKKRKNDCDDSERELSRKINQIQNKLGLFQAEVNRNDKSTDERNELITSIAREMDLKNISTREENIPATITEITESFKSNKKQVQVEEETMANIEDEIQIEIDIAREQSAQFEQKIKSKKAQLAELQNELRTIKNKLEELNTADDQLKLSEQKIQRLEREIKSLEASVDTDQLKQQIEQDKKKLKALQERNEIVDNEVRKLQQFANIQTEVELKQENVLTKRTKMSKLLNTHKETLLYVFTYDLPETGIKAGLEALIKKNRGEYKTLEKEINMNQHKLSKLENTLRSTREKITDKQNEMKNNQEKLDQVCDGKPLEEVAEAATVKLKCLNDKRGSLATSTYLYESFIKNFEEDKPCCPLCKRGVEERQMVDQIIADIRKQIENIPNELEHLDKVLKVEQRWHDNILTLGPLNEKNKQLAEELPQLETQLDRLKKEYRQCSAELSFQQEQLQKVEKNLDMSNSVTGDVSVIDQFKKEINELTREIDELKKNMQTNNSESGETVSRGIDEAITERDSINLEVRNIQNNIESLQTKVCQHTELLHVRREQKNQALTQQLTIKRNLQDKDHLVTKSIEIEDKIIGISGEIAELEDSIGPVKQELMDFIKKKNDLKVKHQKKQELMKAKISRYQKKMDQIANLQAEILRYESKNVIDQMQAVMTEMAGYKTQIDDYTYKKNQIDAKIDELKRKITNAQMYHRELQDNLQLREKRTKSRKLRQEIETEEANLGVNDIKQIRQEKSQLIDDCDRLVKLKHRKEGEKSQLKDNINEIKKELALPEHVKAADAYRSKLMAHLLLDSVIEDLKDFSKAMRWAILQYHKKRMVQVNSIIKDLWRSIYKGNDIDYIEIKTDDVPTSKGQDKRKVYNYKVVQVKNEVELEMRGRCSAGQRVLASLIIRIALAETFSNNCGILALDEPTTNLDRENINSLADALIELIQQKRQQEHFQLLVITHDQEFVERLTQVESLDKYYEITRSAVGKSLITVHNKY